MLNYFGRSLEKAPCQRTMRRMRIIHVFFKATWRVAQDQGCCCYKRQWQLENDIWPPESGRTHQAFHFASLLALRPHQRRPSWMQCNITKTMSHALASWRFLFSVTVTRSVLLSQGYMSTVVIRDAMQMLERRMNNGMVNMAIPLATLNQMVATQWALRRMRSATTSACCMSSPEQMPSNS